MNEKLKELGLSYNERRVYLNLLRIGETSVGEIIKDVKAHRQSVYNALEDLEKRGLILKNKKNQVNHFKVASADAFLEGLKKKELIAKQLKEEIVKEMKKSRHEHQISIYDGQKNFQKFYVDKYKSLPEDSKVYVMGGASEAFEKVITPEVLYGEMEKVIKKKNVIIKNLLTRDAKEYMEKGMKKRLAPEMRETRYLPYNSISPVATIIWPEDAILQFLGDHPFIIEIKDKNFRDSNLEYFKILWKTAEK